MIWAGLISILLTALLVKADALSCYICNSSANVDCMSNLDPVTTPLRPAECNVANSKYCIKTTGTYGGFVGVNRFCSAFDMGTQCDYVSFPDHDRIYRACVYTCQGNRCNKGDTHSFSWLTVLLNTFLLLILRLVVS
ncbi:unnamed protein product [Calicophoron daubneyi]|uniref:Protein sleepless n=1 Tax=Calicophoron daubneyi TaxID=300641 RepID=A0AAV2U1Z3_CALDB